MPKRIHPKVLLVEGNEDKRVIPELMEANGVAWGETPDDAVVYIETFDGVSNLLKPGVIEALLKESGRQIVGIMIDANGDTDSRWAGIRRRCQSQFPQLPVQLPSEGAIERNADGLKLGVWIMPDNKSPGMLETFLAYLAPEVDTAVWRYAVRATRTARRLGASFKESHTTKAHIHTWLAWQDEPGRQLHQAVKERILDPQAGCAGPFVKWFRGLFEV